MEKDIIPTDSVYESQKGRVAVWLDPEDLKWLSTHCCCPPDASKEVTDRCARIRFRTGAALHKSGISST
jgi:hypothetical protein